MCFGVRVERKGKKAGGDVVWRNEIVRVQDGGVIVKVVGFDILVHRPRAGCARGRIPRREGRPQL
jgi:hypothetical protein